MAVFFDGTETINDLVTSDYQELWYPKNIIKAGNTWYVISWITDSPYVDVYKSTDFTTWTSTSFPAPSSGSWYGYFILRKDSSNNVYAYVATGLTSGEIKKYNGSSWSSITSIPSSYEANRLRMEVEDNGYIHLVSMVSKVIQYTYFNGSSWQSWESMSFPTAATTTAFGNIAIDSNSVIHIVCSYYYSGTPVRYIYYNYGTYGSWNGWESVADGSNTNNQDIAIDSNDVIFIANYRTVGIYVYYGNSGSWTTEEIETFSTWIDTQICICSQGTNIHLFYMYGITGGSPPFWTYTYNYSYAYYNGSSWSGSISMESGLSEYAYNFSIFATANSLAVVFNDPTYTIIQAYYKSVSAGYTLKKLSAGVWTGYPLKKLSAGVWTEYPLKQI